MEIALKQSGARFDTSLVRGALVDLMGDDDERVVKFDELVARYGVPKSPN